MESSFTGLLVLAPPTKYRLNSSSVQTFIWELSLLKYAPPFLKTLLYNSFKLQPGFHGPSIHNCIVMGFHCISKSIIKLCTFTCSIIRVRRSSYFQCWNTPCITFSPICFMNTYWTHNGFRSVIIKVFWLWLRFSSRDWFLVRMTISWTGWRKQFYHSVGA